MILDFSALGLPLATIGTQEHEYLRRSQRYEKRAKNQMFLDFPNGGQLEKPRAFDPRGQSGFDP